MICPHCDSKNPEGVEVCQVCRQRFPATVSFGQPVEKLREIGRRVVRRDLPADPSHFHRVFETIEEQVQEVLDKAVELIEANITDLQRIQEEARRNGIEVEELDLESFTQMLNEFENVQIDITSGLKEIKDSIVDARTSEDITRGLRDYSEGMSQIEAAFNRLETLIFETSDVSTLTQPPEDLDVPSELFLTQRELGKAVKSLDAFEDMEDPKLLRYALVKMEVAKEVIFKMLEDYEDVDTDTLAGEVDELEETYADETLMDEEFEEEMEEEFDEIDEEELTEEEALELMYKDVEEIVSIEGLKELMSTSDDSGEEAEGYEEIFKDRDWKLVEKEEIAIELPYKSKNHEFKEETAEEQPADEEFAGKQEEYESGIAQSISSLIKQIEQ
ncbi:MAG: hypothetical protein ACLFQV_00530 [Vulcanimicrobiota bacterium]